MADFTSELWSWFVAVSTIVSILGLLVFVLKIGAKKLAPGEKAQSQGHVWDEDLYELNHPAPRWWYFGFIISIFWGGLYLFLYPGLGSFAGYLGWSQFNQYDEEIARAESEYGPLYEQFLNQDLVALSQDPAAREVGHRLYSNYCSTCHGSDARGARGFPNLRDSDWLYGGDPENIKTSILKGRQGVMAAWGPLLKEEDILASAEYVKQLSGRDVDTALAEKGKTTFDTYCMACHGMDGKGNIALGAPNLTDNIWLYGGSTKSIIKSITEGRGGVMPPHENFLGEAKVHVLAAYIYGLNK